MTPSTEQLVRDTLAADAAEAPGPDGLAEAALARARAHRRRTWSVAGAATVVAVAVGVAGVWAAGPDGDSSPPSGHALPLVTPTTAPNARALQFRGVFVPVPPAMLRPDALQCGTAQADAAYVYDPNEPVQACAINPPHPERLTEVVLEDAGLFSIPDNPVTTVLDDGRTQVLYYVPDRQVRLRVMSPDADRAAQIVAGAYVVVAPDDCAVHEPAGATPGPGPWIDPPLVYPDARVLSICGYRDGWLTQSTAPAPGEDDDLVAALAAVPPAVDLPAACREGSEGDAAGPGFWLVTLADSGPKQVFVYGEECSRIVAGEGRVAMPTNDVVSALWRTAVSGPFWFTGLGK